MTTTVTVKTHAWPVSVTTESNHSFRDDRRSSHGYSRSEEFVPKDSERSFNVTDTTSVTVRELPAEATGLYVGEPFGLTLAPLPETSVD